MSAQVPALSVAHVSKSFNGQRVLSDISLEVSPGETICIIGPSGSGKSTFLRCLNALERPDSGVVAIGNDPIGVVQTASGLVPASSRQLARQRAEVGMVFQSFNLFPHLTVEQNIIEAPIRVRGVAPKTAKQLSRVLLERVGLAEKAGVYPATLSGGQQQRVAIVRALAMKPQVMLFDEPTSALDREMVHEVLEVMRELSQQGMTMLVVTHELEFAREVADRIVFIEDGQIVAQGSPDQILLHPENPRVRQFLSKVG